LVKTLPLGQLNSALPSVSTPSSPDKSEGTGFSDVLKESIDAVNEKIQQAESLSLGLADGHHSNIHETMIAIEKAGISFKLMTRVQQKAIQAYQDVMRIQL